MILYLLVMAQRPSPLGTGVETSEVESVMIVVLYFQMISISVTVHLFCML